MNQARISPRQSRIIELRDESRLSWGLIARQVSVEFQKPVSAANCRTYYVRAKKALAGYKNIEERQAEWDDPKNRAQRYSRRQWKKFSPARRKLEWRLSPFAPDPIQRALNPPKRAPKKSGEELVKAKRKLAELRRSLGDEEGAAQIERSLSDASEPPAPMTVRARPEPPRVLPPAAVAASVPVILPVPKPKPPAKPERKIYVFDWRPVDRSGIFDAAGDRVFDPSKYVICQVQKTEQGYTVLHDGEEVMFSCDGQLVRLQINPATRRITAAFAPIWRVPAPNEVFDWNEGKERRIFRFADGKIVAWVQGTGRWSDQIFCAPDDAFVITDCKAADELIPYVIFRDGEFWASRNGEGFTLELERPCKATGLDYETLTEYQVREIQVSYSPNPKHPRQSWLRVLRIAPMPSADTLSLPVPRRFNPAARDLELAWYNARVNSRRREIKLRDADREQQRQEPPDREPTEDDYFHGIGF